MIEKIPYTFEAHNFIKLKNVPWVYCKYCGLLKLNNALTSWCVKMGCNNGDHPNHNNMVKKLSK